MATIARVVDGRRVPVHAEVVVRDTAHGPRARIVGPIRCNSPHGCPVCGERLRGEAARRVRQLVAEWRSRGGHVLMATVTVRHDRRVELQPTVKLLQRSWNKFTRSAAWRRVASRLGLAGHCHAIEATLGTSGWHPHVHGLLLIDATAMAGLQGHGLRRLERELQRQWLAAVERGLRSLNRRTEADRRAALPAAGRGLRLTIPGVGDYLVKTAANLQGSGVIAGESMHQVMSRAAGEADPKTYWRRRWSEYVKGMKGVQLVAGLTRLEARLAASNPSGTPASPTSGRTSASSGTSRSRSSVSSARHVERIVARIPAGDYNELTRRAGVANAICRGAEAHGCAGVAIVAAYQFWGVRTWFLQKLPPKVEALRREYDPARDPAVERHEAATQARRHTRRSRQRAITLAVFSARRSGRCAPRDAARR